MTSEHVRMSCEEKNFNFGKFPSLKRVYFILFYSETAKEVVPPKAVFDMSDSDAPHIASASDGTKFNVFGSETETDDMHGGR